MKDTQALHIDFDVEKEDAPGVKIITHMYTCRLHVENNTLLQRVQKHTSGYMQHANKVCK